MGEGLDYCYVLAIYYNGLGVGVPFVRAMIEGIGICMLV